MASTYAGFNSNDFSYSFARRFSSYDFTDQSRRKSTEFITMKNYKAVLYGAVAYSAIIGAIYLALSICGLLTRWCVIESKGSPLAYLLYLIYFRVHSCEPSINWELLGVTSNVVVDFPKETDVASRTFIFLVTYLALHVALIVTSLYGLCGVNNSCLGRRSFPIFFAPWLVIYVAIVVLDLLATVYHIIDFVYLLSGIPGLMGMLQVQNSEQARPAFDQLPSHVVILPAIIMLSASIKILLFFITNIVFIVAITKAGWTASTYHKYLDKTKRSYENTMASVNPAFEGLRDDIVAQKQHERQIDYMNESVQEVHPSSSSNNQIATAPPVEQAETRYRDTSPKVQGAVYPYQNRNEKRTAPQPPQTIEEEEPQGYKIKRPTTLIIPERQQQQHQQTQYNNNNNNNNVDREIESRLSNYRETTGSAVRTQEALKYDDVPEKQQSNSRVLVLPPITEANNRSSLKPIPPPKPQNNNNRLSMQPSGRDSPPFLYRPERTNSARVERTSSNLRAPDELRSQLPWSYFKPRDEAPKKAFDHLDEGEEIPAVPVPDYTLHYGKKSRSNLSDSDADGNWNQQRY